MKWQQFLTDIRKATIVTLVGPLYGKMHTPATPTVYVDAGAHFRSLNSTNNSAEVSVGDGDSAETALDENHDHECGVDDAPRDEHIHQRNEPGHRGRMTPGRPLPRRVHGRAETDGAEHERCE